MKENEERSNPGMTLITNVMKHNGSVLCIVSGGLSIANAIVCCCMNGEG